MPNCHTSTVPKPLFLALLTLAVAGSITSLQAQKPAASTSEASQRTQFFRVREGKSNPQPANRFESEIASFERRDQVSPPPTNAILFTGSSSIRLWSNIEAAFAPLSVFARGFGGSQFSDLIYFTPRIVIPYAPRQIVVYEGDNDLASGKPAEQVLADYRTFVGLARAQWPKIRISFIAVKPSRARQSILQTIRSANTLVRNYSDTDNNLDYIDIFTPMLDAQGQPRNELLASDGLHLSPEGYALWTGIIRPFLTP